jgi:hypothetical protein
MPVQVQDLTTLDPNSVDQIESRLIQLIKELEPGVDLNVGVVRMLVLHLKSVLDAATKENVSLLEESGSLKAVTENPALQDNTTVDRVLSNFRLVRSPGIEAGGDVTIVLSALTPAVIVKNTIFIINGISFVANESYAARTSLALVTGPNDRLLMPIGGGQYVFTISVTASSVGSAGNVPAASAAVPDAVIPSFVQAYAAIDFTGGADPSTNEQLLNQLALGLAVRAWSNRVSIEALIKTQPSFVNVGPMSIIGFGDPEMIRDQHAIWPGSLGGRSDLYVRTTPLYQTRSVTLPGSLIAKVGPLGTWQIGISRDAIPGYYEIDKVLLPSMALTAPGFPVATEVRSIDLTGLDFQADITLVKEGTYSRYQAAVITFDDTTTDATALPLATVQDYVVVAKAMPLLADVQDFLMTRQVRPPMGDALTRGPVPCFTTVSFTLNMASGSPSVDQNLVKTNVANAVNAQGFIGQLSASFIDQVLHATVPGLVTVSAMTLNGRVRKPDGANTLLGPSAVSLVIPTDYPNMTSGRTTVFFLNPSSITIVVVIL